CADHTIVRFGLVGVHHCDIGVTEPGFPMPNKTSCVLRPRFPFPAFYSPESAAARSLEMKFELSRLFLPVEIARHLVGRFIEIQSRPVLTVRNSEPSRFDCSRQIRVEEVSPGSTRLVKRAIPAFALTEGD